MPPTPPMEHVRALCEEIGPRGSTTEEEAQAAAYASKKLREAGITNVRVEPFRNVSSSSWAVAVAFALILASTGVFYLKGPDFSDWEVHVLLIGLLVMLGEGRHWRLSLSNFLPKRDSQNVLGKVLPKGFPRQKLILVGHLDTFRTPILHRDGAVRFMLPFFKIVGYCILVKSLVFMEGSYFAPENALYAAAFVLDIPVIIALLLVLHGDFFTPFTEGANDNASGAAVVLSLAELFQREPLAHTELWALCTGCEEARLGGMSAFLDEHRDELEDASFIVLDAVGIGDLRYTTREGGRRKYIPDPDLVRVAESVRLDGDSQIQGMRLKMGQTEMSIIRKRGFRGISIMARPDGVVATPGWHQVSDSIDNLEPQTVEKTFHYVASLVRTLDSDRSDP